MTVSSQISTESLAVRLPWQEAQWQRLMQVRASDRLPHALLLSGPPGVGKGRFALALAHLLMCASPKEQAPCGECRQCGYNKAGTHPDLKLVEPEGVGKQIKVDQVRTLVEFVAQTSQQGGYKIVVLAPAESMNINAANALLKSLEEPSANTLLILMTHTPGQLLATIRSRCQSVPFPVPEADVALSWLTPLVSGAEQAQTLLTEASGQPMTALALLESDGLNRYQVLDDDFLAMLNTRQQCVAMAQKWQEHELGEILIWLGRRLSALIRARCAEGEINSQWRNGTSKADTRALFLLRDQIVELKAKLDRGANPNPQLALEELLLDCCETFQVF